MQFLWDGSTAFRSQPGLAAYDHGYKQPSQYCYQQVEVVSTFCIW